MSDLVEEWLSGRPKNTYYAFKGRFQKFCEFTGKTPEQLLQIRKTQGEERIIEQLALRFIRQLKTSSNTKRLWLSAIRSFFDFHFLPLHFRRSELPKREQTEHYTPTKEEIVKLFNACDLKQKVMLVLLYQAGLSPADVVKLRINDFEEIEGFAYINKIRTKSKQKIRTFVCPDGFETIKNYIARFGISDKLFPKSNGEGARYIRENLKPIIRKLNMNFTIRSIRRSFGNALMEAEVEPARRVILMGHVFKSVHGEYMEPTKKQLFYSYRQAEPYLRFSEKSSALGANDKEQIAWILSKLLSALAKQEPERTSRLLALASEIQNSLSASEESDSIINMIAENLDI